MWLWGAPFWNGGRRAISLQPLVAKGPSREGWSVDVKVGIDCEGVTGGDLAAAF
jgi:hypothetical protein